MNLHKMSLNFIYDKNLKHGDAAYAECYLNSILMWSGLCVYQYSEIGNSFSHNGIHIYVRDETFIPTNILLAFDGVQYVEDVFIPLGYNVYEST